MPHPVNAQRDESQIPRLKPPISTASFFPLSPSPPPSPPLAITIVGAGFAGVSCAIACARQGFSVTLLERGSASGSAHGDLVTVGANAAKVLWRWGVGEAIWERSARGNWRFHTARGELVRTEDLSDFPALYGAPVLQGSRAEFLSILRDEARFLGVDFRAGTNVVEYWDLPISPAVVTADGDIIHGDVVIVADGINSNARELLESHLPRPSRPAVPRMGAGYSVYRGVMDSDAILEDKSIRHLLDGSVRFWLGDDAHAVIAPMACGRQLSFTFTHRDPQRRATTLPHHRLSIGEVAGHLWGWDPVLVKAVEHFKTVLNWRTPDEDVAEEWITFGGKIAFMGDNVHGLLPSSYQGASQAIEDGATIAACLALAGGTPETASLALKVYQDLRRPRVVRAQQLGRDQRDSWHAYWSDRRPSLLAFLPSELYDHDAEKHAGAAFERVARQLDGWFVAVPALKRAFLEKARIGGHWVL